MHRTRNAAYSQGYRGFESPPLRQPTKVTRQQADVGRVSWSYAAAVFAGVVVPSTGSLLALAGSKGDAPAARLRFSGAVTTDMQGWAP